MTAVQLLDNLHNRGVTLFVEEGRLRYKAVPGTYAAELRRRGRTASRANPPPDRRHRRW